MSAASLKSPPRGAPKPFLHKGSQQLAVKIRGRFYYLGKDPEAAQVEYQRLIREVWAKPVSEAPEGLTLAQLDRLTIIDLLTAYWCHADKYYVKDGRPTSTIAGITPALRLLRERYGEQLAADFGPLKLEALREVWIQQASPRSGKRLSRTAINHYTFYVKRVFYWAAGKQLVPASVADALRYVPHLAAGRCQARESEPVTAVEEELVDATLPHVSQTIRDMIIFQKLTGARPGEVCNLFASDVQRYAEPARSKHRTATLPLFADGELPPPRVRLPEWEWRPRSHKMQHKNRQRVVFIGPRAQAIVEEYLARAGAGKVFPYTVAAYRRAIARAVVRAFMPKELRMISTLPAERQAALRLEAAAWRDAHVWHPNQLRHLAATMINAHYGDDDAARCVLGHDSKDTTQIYVERDLARARSIAREVG